MKPIGARSAFVLTLLLTLLLYAWVKLTDKPRTKIGNVAIPCPHQVEIRTYKNEKKVRVEICYSKGVAQQKYYFDGQLVRIELVHPSGRKIITYNNAPLIRKFFAKQFDI